MEIKIKLKIKEGLKIPNCNDIGEVEEGFWDKQDVEDHFKSGLVCFLKNRIREEILHGNYIDDLNFEGIESAKDLKDKFDFDVLIDGKSIEL